MLKQFLNGGSLKSLMLFAPDDEAAAKAKLREQLAKGNTEPPNEEEEEQEEQEQDEPKLDEDGNPIVEQELSEEEKAAAEKAEKEAAKARRKEERTQRRIDELTAKAKAAEEALAEFKNANPDSKLTEAEIEARAEALADKKLAAKQLKEIQDQFDADCDKLQKAGKKLDKDFDAKVEDMADQFGKIPSFMIGVLSDFENGADVLVHLANDDDEAERIFGLQSKPAKMTKELVEISNKITITKAEAEKAANKSKEKKVSKVPDPIIPVNGGRVQSTQITADDTKPENIDNYIRKRQAQIEQRRKQGRL